MFTNQEYRDNLIASGLGDKVYNLLPTSQRQLYKWYVLDGEPIIDIANETHKDRKTVRRWLKEMFEHIYSDMFQAYLRGNLTFETPFEEDIFRKVYLEQVDYEIYCEDSMLARSTLDKWHSRVKAKIHSKGV